MRVLPLRLKPGPQTGDAEPTIGGPPVGGQGGSRATSNAVGGPEREELLCKDGHRLQDGADERTGGWKPRRYEEWSRLGVIRACDCLPDTCQRCSLGLAEATRSSP